MSGARRGAAVLGSPISHSLSPALHQAAYDALGLTDWTYRAIECTKATLAETLHVLDGEGLAGASLTMPLKQAVLPLVARTDRVVAEVGAANTVLFGMTGDWWAGNTDVPGVVAVLRDQGIGATASVTVLGAGATAASAVAAIADLGISSVTVVARRPEAAADVVDVGIRRMVGVEVVSWSAAGERLDADVVIATVPAGGTDALTDAVPRRPGLYFDVVYAPWPTVLAAAWAAAGGVVVGGLELLIAQAAEQVFLMTGQQPPVAAMRAAVRT
jgi:shikimate dehydrogenase